VTSSNAFFTTKARKVKVIVALLGKDRIPARVKRFVKQSGIPLNVVQKFAEVIAFSTEIETQLECQVAKNAHLTFAFATIVIWGGDRCLLNTHDVIQKMLDLVQDRTTS
jgi:hypothetical protein